MAARAQTIVGRMAMGMVYLPKTAPRYPALEAECLAFDAGKHDDIVDRLSLPGRLVHGMARGQHPAPAQEEISVIEATDTGNPLAPPGLDPDRLDFVDQDGASYSHPGEPQIGPILPNVGDAPSLFGL